jgi:alkylation response protein AidB-like acyl-CoA dehydrogenase
MRLLNLNAEQKQIVKIVKDFTDKEIKPCAAKWDEEEKFPRAVFDKMSEIGLSGISCQEEYGGSYLDCLTKAMVFEELSKGCVAMAATLSVHTMVAYVIEKYASEEMKKKYLPRINSGEMLCAYALTEANAGSDAAALETRAERGNGGFVLNGNKIFITSAGEAELYFVMAKTDKSKGARGITSFLVEKGNPGLGFGKKEKKMGFNASVTGELVLTDCVVPEEAVVGSVGEGFRYALETLDFGRVNIAAMAVGLAQSAFDYALEYAKNRVQFGKPISSFQGIQFMLADMATEIEAGRGLAYNAAQLMDNRASARDVTLAAAMAKRFATDTAMKVTTDAVQILGGYGCMKEYPVERYMRSAKIMQIVEGTNQIQRVIVARELLA